MLVEAYPALAAGLDAHPEDLAGLVARHAPGARRCAPTGASPPPPWGTSPTRPPCAAGCAGSRRASGCASPTRELQAHPGHDVDVTARELSDLADVCCEVALAEALAWAEARFGAADRGERRALPVRRRRHGQARGARAQRRQRRRPDALLRDRRRRGRASTRCTSTSRASRSASSPRSTSPPRTASSGASTCACARRGRAVRWSTRSPPPSGTTRRGAGPGSARRSCARGPWRATCASGRGCSRRSRRSCGDGRSTRASSRR